MKKVALLLWLALLGVFCLGAAAQAEFSLRYDLIILDLPDGFSDDATQANAIEDAGRIVGTYRSGTPIYWRPDGYAMRIPVPYGYGEAFYIDGHQVFGVASNAIGWKRAFYWAVGDAQVQLMGYLPDLYDSAAFTHGAGCSYDHYTSNSEQACYFNDDGETAVALSPGKRSCVLGRAGNTYVGWEKSERTGGNQHAVVWDGGPAGWMDLTPEASLAAATAARVGWVFRITGYVGGNPFIWDNIKGLRPITISGKGLAINGLGQVVGRCDDFGTWPRAFIWEEGQGIELLNNLVLDSERGTFEIAEARGINDAGEIVGWGYYQSSQPVKRAFLMKPTPRVPPVVAVICLELLMMD